MQLLENICVPSTIEIYIFSPVAGTSTWCSVALDRCYTYHSSPLEWEEARDDCSSSGRGLVVVGSADEQTGVEAAMAALGVSQTWMGVQEEASHLSKWRWVQSKHHLI